MNITPRYRYTGIVDAPLLTREDEIKLSKTIQGKNKARAQKAINTFIVSNLRLVAKIVNSEYHTFADPDDLISEGAIGLYEAARRFDSNKKVKFSTYAAWWIRQRITNYIERSHMITLSSHAHSMYSKLRRMTDSIEAELGRPPTDEELMEMTGISEQTLKMFARNRYSTVSIDAAADFEESRYNDTSTLKDRLVDHNAVQPDQKAENKQDYQHIIQYFKHLTEQERFILTTRFGLNGENRYHLEQIGEMYSLTRERIRQIQNIALNKLRKKIRMPENNLPQCV
jgi:RNA polymerase primary sigma factor